MDFLNVRIKIKKIKIKNKTTSFWTLNVCHLTGIKKTSKLNKTKSQQTELNKIEVTTLN